MKLFVGIFIFIILMLGVFSPQVSAHREGVPILKINGQLVKIYFDRNFSGFIFDLPYDADRAPENYVVNQQLEMELDVSKFPVSSDILEKSEIIWDYGDQVIERGNGKVRANHHYQNPGTYTIQITASLKNAGYPEIEDQPLQTLVLNVLPSKDYLLPEAKIKVNDQLVEMPVSLNESTSSATPSAFIPTKTYKFDFNKKLTFDASNSIPGSAKIKSYRWDFGQGKESNRKIDKFQYKLPQYYISAVLRVEDENGYFSDTFVNLENSGSNEENNPEKSQTLIFLAVLGGAMLLTGVIGFLITLLLKKMKIEI